MAEARCEHDWGMASSVMAMLAEIHRDRRRRRRPFSPTEFNPLRQKVSRPIPVTVSQLAIMLGRPLKSNSNSES